MGSDQSKLSESIKSIQSIPRCGFSPNKNHYSLPKAFVARSPVCQTFQSACTPPFGRNGNLRLYFSDENGHSHQGDYINHIRIFRNDLKHMREHHPEFERQLTTAIEHLEMIHHWETDFVPKPKLVKEQIAHTVEELEFVKDNLDGEVHPADFVKLRNLIVRLKTEANLLFNFEEDFSPTLPVMEINATSTGDGDAEDDEVAEIHLEVPTLMALTAATATTGVGAGVWLATNYVNLQALVGPEQALVTTGAVVLGTSGVVAGSLWIRDFLITFDACAKKKVDDALAKGEDPWKYLFPEWARGATTVNGSEQQKDGEEEFRNTEL